MNAPLSPKPVYLPLRIVPRRKAQLAVIALQASGLAVLAVALSRPFAGNWQDRAGATPLPFVLLIGAVLLGVAVVASMLAASVLRLLPGSPLSHLRLTWDAIAVRSPFGTRQFAWTELGRFAVVTAPNDYEINYIVAPSAEADFGPADDRARLRRAVFRVRSDPYCSPTEAEAMAGWLNEVRAAVSRREPCEIAFFAPLSLFGNLVAGAAPGEGKRDG